MQVCFDFSPYLERVLKRRQSTRQSCLTIFTYVSGGGKKLRYLRVKSWVLWIITACQQWLFYKSMKIIQTRSLRSATILLSPHPVFWTAAKPVVKTFVVKRSGSVAALSSGASICLSLRLHLETKQETSRGMGQSKPQHVKPCTLCILLFVVVLTASGNDERVTPYCVTVRWHGCDSSWLVGTVLLCQLVMIPLHWSWDFSFITWLVVLICLALA